MTPAAEKLLPGQQAALLAYLRDHSGEVCTINDLVGALYPNPDQEPEWANGIVRIILHRLRKKGATVEHVSGWRLA